jgi:hypothetical protein
MTGVRIALIIFHIVPIHQKKCGGTFIKIAEPEGYVDKKKLKEEKSKNRENTLD